MHVLVIGAGAIGSFLAEGLVGEPAVEVFVHDRDQRRAEDLAKKVPGVIAAADPRAMLDDVDLVVEAASQKAVAEFGPAVVDAGVDLVILSVGALVDDRLRDRLLSGARATGARIRVPSGAVGAVDALKAAALGGIDDVTLTTRKTPASLGLPAATRARTVFEGPAREAVARFPRNVNVAAVLALAGVGFDRTKVRIVADPAVQGNRHEVEVRGPFGEFRFEVRNEPFADQPATSRLAAHAALAIIRRMHDPLAIGT